VREFTIVSVSSSINLYFTFFTDKFSIPFRSFIKWYLSCLLIGAWFAPDVVALHGARFSICICRCLLFRRHRFNSFIRGNQVCSPSITLWLHSTFSQKNFNFLFLPDLLLWLSLALSPFSNGPHSACIFPRTWKEKLKGCCCDSMTSDFEDNYFCETGLENGIDFKINHSTDGNLDMRPITYPSRHLKNYFFLLNKTHTQS